MKTLAFLLTHPSYLDDPRTAATFYLPLITTTICCYLLSLNLRFVSYAVGIAALSALVVIAPLRQWFSAPSGVYYGFEEFLCVLFAALFPFIAIAVFHFFPPRKKPNQPPEPTR